MKWAELYPYMDVQEMTLETKKAALPDGEDGQLQRLSAACGVPEIKNCGIWTSSMRSFIR